MSVYEEEDVSERGGYPRVYQITHTLIGGGIIAGILFVMLCIFNFQWIALVTLLNGLNCLGLILYPEIAAVSVILSFAVIYMPSGFCGGLYTGYRIKENLRIILLIPALLGFLFIILILFWLFPKYRLLINPIRDILIPLIGIITGSYLGGYSMNWGVEAEEAEGVKEETTIQMPKFKEAEAGVEEAERLERLRGIGPTRAERLKDAGIKTISDLAEAEVEDLHEETGIPRAVLLRAIEEARKLKESKGEE